MCMCQHCCERGWEEEYVRIRAVTRMRDEDVFFMRASRARECGQHVRATCIFHEWIIERLSAVSFMHSGLFIKSLSKGVYNAISLKKKRNLKKKFFNQ